MNRAALVTTGLAGLAAAQALTTWHGSPLEPAALAVAVGMGLAAFGFTRRSLQAQVTSRGVVILGAAPLVVGLASGATAVGLEIASAALAAIALWLGRPMLETEEAKAAFAPARFRGAFLAGATTISAAAAGAAAYAIMGVAVHAPPIMVAFNSVLAVLLLVAVRALLKMRTWGLLLGAVVSLGLVALAPFFGSTDAVTLTLAATPALLLWVVPLLLARRVEPSIASEQHVRVALEVADEREAEAALEEDERADERPHLAVSAKLR